MEHTRLLSTTYVQPQNHMNQFKKIELTPADLQYLLTPPIQSGILFYKPKSDDHESSIFNLKAAFSRALDIFYPLAGRLIITEKDDNTTSFSLDCNSSGAGAQFVHAAADGVTVGDILDPVYVPDDIVSSFFLMNGIRNYEGKSRPLLAVQVTELVDGIFIGITMNHIVGDGTSFWEFFNTWSEISRCGKTSLAVPIFGREFLDGKIDLPVRIPSNYLQDLLVVPTVKEENPSPPPADLLIKRRIFHFRKEKIAEIKSKANTEMGVSNISSLQALMGHMWISITRVRQRLYSNATDQETKYLVALSLRQRMQPPLPDQYLGNAVIVRAATSTVENLLERGPGSAALELNKMIALQSTQQVVENFWKDWAENPKLPTIPTIGIVQRSHNILTGNSPRFNVYGNDFGWGRPVAVRSVPVRTFDGRLHVYPGAEQGNVEFDVSLSASTLQALAEDLEFMATVGL